MSIRLGTSSNLSRRANVRRVREVATEAKTATPPEDRCGAGHGARKHPGAPTQDSTANQPRKGRFVRSKTPSRVTSGRLRCLQNITGRLRPQNDESLARRRTGVPPPRVQTRRSIASFLEALTS